MKTFLFLAGILLLEFFAAALYVITLFGGKP